MDWVRPTACWAMAAVVPATGPPSPMFSPAAVQSTPAAVSRSPIGGSPRHWWESPQPLAIRKLCADELASRPEVIVSAGSLAAERAWLISASTCTTAVPPAAAGGLSEAAVDAAGWALAAPIAGSVGRRDGDRGDGGAAMAIPAGLPAQPPTAATPHPAATVRELTTVRPDAGPGESTLRAR